LLIGRQRELQRIDELLEDARCGNGAAAILEGPAGIGKTALLREAGRQGSGSGFQVLRATGGQLERQYPFGVVRQLFWALVAPGSASMDLLDGAAGRAAAALGLPDPLAGHTRSWGDATSAAMHGLYWVSANLAEHAPLLVILDDAHWADAASLEFVLYLARRVEDLTVLLLVAARPTAERSDDGSLAQLRALPALERLRPTPLDAPEVARLIAGSGLREPDEEFVEACHRATGGNPFLVGELLAGLAAEGATGSSADAARIGNFAPETIVRWVLSRLTALGQGAEQLAFAFAVLGAAARLADAAELAGLEPGSAAAAADALVGAHILALERGYDFVHPLIAAAAREALGPARRAEAHGRAARLAAKRRAPLAQVAAHLLACDPRNDAWVVEVLRDAAREAQARGAPTSAASYLERALAETSPPEVRAELLVELGETQLQAGLPRATHRIREALELSADPRRRAEICLALGRALFTISDYDGAQVAFARGLTELPEQDDDLLLALRTWYVAVSGDNRDIEPSVMMRWQGLSQRDWVARSPEERSLLAFLAYEAGRSGAQPHDQVAKLARNALADGALLNDIGRDMVPYGAACHALWFAGELDAVIAELDRAVELSQRFGSVIGFIWFSRLRGIARFLRGDVLDALADLESAGAEHADGRARSLVETRSVLALCLIERDDLAAAARALELPGGEERWQRQPAFRTYLYALARLQTVRGQIRGALDTLLRCEKLVRELNYPNPAASLPWRSDAALLAARLGEPKQARTLITEDLQLAQAFGARHAVGAALRATGLLEGGQQGLEQLAQAVAVLDGSHVNLELARTLTDYGAALRRAGQRRGAREPLRRALDLATRCGALGLSRRAREELIAAGARPRREHIDGVEALTPSELRVAQLAAHGRTNRQIAQALFVSMHTVSTHLGHVYSKLDVTDRAQLPAALSAKLSEPA
jgi:DNA-binding CsgD family transcriptional regulator